MFGKCYEKVRKTSEIFISNVCSVLALIGAQILRSETEEPSDGLSQIAARILATSFAYVS